MFISRMHEAEESLGEGEEGDVGHGQLTHSLEQERECAVTLSNGLLSFSSPELSGEITLSPTTSVATYSKIALVCLRFLYSSMCIPLSCFPRVAYLITFCEHLRMEYFLLRCLSIWDVFSFSASAHGMAVTVRSCFEYHFAGPCDWRPHQQQQLRVQVMPA